MIEIIPIDFEIKKDFDRWQDFIYSREDTHCTDLAQWRLLFKELYGFKNYTFVCVDNNQI